MLKAHPLFIAVLSIATYAADITGAVTNKTTGKPAANAQVSLLKLEGGMQEIARGTSDAQGRFTIQFPDDRAMHLVRVNYRNVNYHRPAPPGTTSVEVDVYDASDKVDGIKQTFDIVRVEADATTLRITEDFVVENNSRPPRTLVAPNAFEVKLPEGATLDQAMAAGPGGMAVRVAPVQTNEPNKYAFLFPIRPGEANFRVMYTMPYSGSAQLRPTLLRAAENYAVSVPKSMSLKPGAGSRLEQKGDEMGMTVFVAADAQPGQDLSYSISGTGAVPQSDAGGQSSAGPPRPGGGIGNPINTPDPLTKYRWWIIGGLVLAMVAGAGFVMSRADAPAKIAAASSQGGLLEAIKEELFELERDRMQGKIADADYQRVRAALEVVLSRAMERQSRSAARA